MCCLWRHGWWSREWSRCRSAESTRTAPRSDANRMTYRLDRLDVGDVLRRSTQLRSMRLRRRRSRDDCYRRCADPLLVDRPDPRVGLASVGAEVNPLNIENWLRDRQVEDDLERYYGWREPTHEELAQERLDEQDRLEDRGGGLMTPRREPAPVHPSGRSSVHHTVAPPLPSSSGTVGPRPTSPGA